MRLFSPLRSKLIITTCTALLAAILAAPGVFAAEPNTKAPDAYNLQGDTVNSGVGVTWFLSSAGNASLSTWLFNSSSSTSGTTTLESECTAANCTGVLGDGLGRGVYGTTDAASGIGVLGIHTSSSGSLGYGVRGETNSTADGAVAIFGRVNPTTAGTDSAALFGLNLSTSRATRGVLGTIYSGDPGAAAVWGEANAGTALGVVGIAGAGDGVYGKATSGNGVYGTSASGVALFGNNTGSGSGFYGFSANGPGGVMGSNTTEGARFYTRNTSSYAIVTGQLAGTFGDAYIGGDMNVTGACCAAVQTESGGRQMYAQQATTNLFSDQGFGRLTNGRAVITIDPLYAETVSLDQPYHVFLTPYSADTAGLAVVKRTATSFEVQELGGGKGAYEFSWRIEAARKGYEAERMAPVTQPAQSGKVYELPTIPTTLP